MAEKRGQYQYNDDGTVSQLVQSNTIIDESKAIVPVDIQARLSQTIQTHNAVSVAATTGSSNSTWFDCDGFDNIAINVKSDAAHAYSVDIWWSTDGVNAHGYDLGLGSASRQFGSSQVPVKARYAQITLKNTDAASHIMSAYAHLKA